MRIRGFEQNIESSKIETNYEVQERENRCG